MVALISNLGKKERRALLHDLNYLNTGEIKGFCKRHAIPFRIAVETTDGRRRKTKDEDRKGVMLRRVRHFLQTGAVLQGTCFPSTVVSFEVVPEKLAASDRLFYGQYGKSNCIVMALLRELTGGEFEDGAIARILAREFWSRGEAPTFQEYASAWLRAQEEHEKPNPEWAYLSDRAEKRSSAEWKNVRIRKAKKVMKVLNKIRARKRWR
jgi:hypothetical protein